MYQKTALGQQEINLSERTLNFRQRQVLIMIDGKRSLDDLAQYFSQINIKDILSDLEQQGYIHNQDTKPFTPAKPAAPTTINTDSGEVQLSANQTLIIKEILLASTDQYLGMMGRPVKQKIEAAETYAQLKACISLWHMAMRESKLGREPASFLMEEIQQTMENKIMDMKNLSEQTAVSQDQH